MGVCPTMRLKPLKAVLVHRLHLTECPLTHKMYKKQTLSVRMYTLQKTNPKLGLLHCTDLQPQRKGRWPSDKSICCGGQIP